MIPVYCKGVQVGELDFRPRGYGCRPWVELSVDPPLPMPVMPDADGNWPKISMAAIESRIVRARLLVSGADDAGYIPAGLDVDTPDALVGVKGYWECE